MSKNEQSDRAIHHRDEHDESRKRGTARGTGRTDETNELVEAEAVDEVTPNNEPKEEASDRETP